MVDSSRTRRLRGRPREFDPGDALDRAVEVFWREGYVGADMTTIASAMGLTKPSIYAAFGDKRQLFFKALQRYGTTIGSEGMKAFVEAATIDEAVCAFFTTVARNQAGREHPAGCLLACVAAQSAETMAEVRDLYAAGLAATDAALTARFEAAVEAGELPHDFPCRARAQLMVDLMQGHAVRARATSSAKDRTDFVERARRAVLAAPQTDQERTLR